MSTKDLEQALTQELVEVTVALKSIAVFDEKSGDWSAVPSQSANEPDSNDAADVAEDSIERQAEVSALETRYRNIQRALEKITNGSNPTCEICGKEIEPDRLTANPAARTCIEDIDRESELTL